jgi:hypothetical protein
LKVDEKGILRYSDCGEGAYTFISKRKFENVWKKLTGSGYFKVATGWEIACACIARLPEVEYSLNPVIRK